MFDSRYHNPRLGAPQCDSQRISHAMLPFAAGYLHQNLQSKDIRTSCWTVNIVHKPYISI